MSRKGFNYSPSSLLQEQMDEIYYDDCEDWDEWDVRDNFDFFDDDDCGGCENCVRSKPYDKDDHQIFSAVAKGHFNLVKTTIQKNKTLINLVSKVE
jgi:hypothetical protein